MPTLKGRPSGLKVEVTKGTRGNIVLKRNGALYKEYIALRSDDKSVMDALMMMMRTHHNDLCVSGETLDLIVKSTGYAPQSVKDSVVRLAVIGLVMRTSLSTELLVNPTLATKGNEEAIWKYHHALEYSFNKSKLIEFNWVF